MVSPGSSLLCCRLLPGRASEHLASSGMQRQTPVAGTLALLSARPLAPCHLPHKAGRFTPACWLVLHHPPTGSVLHRPPTPLLPVLAGTSDFYHNYVKGKEGEGPPMAPATDIAWGCIKEKQESSLIIPRTAAKVFVSGACDPVCCVRQLRALALCAPQQLAARGALSASRGDGRTLRRHCCAASTH